MQNLLDNDAEQQSKSVGTYCWLDCPGLKTYVCNISCCTKPFTSPGALFTHVKDAHSPVQGCMRRDDNHENMVKTFNGEYETSVNSEDEAPSDSEEEYLPQPSNSEYQASSNSEDEVPWDSEDEYMPQKSDENATSSNNEDESTQEKRLFKRRKKHALYHTKKHQKNSVPSSNIPRIARPQTAAVDYQSTHSTGSLSSLSATSNLNGVFCTMNDLDSVMAVISKQRSEGQQIPALDKRKQGSVNEDMETSPKRQKTRTIKPKIKVVGYPSSTGSGVKNVFICVQCDSKFSSLVETVKHIDTHVMKDENTVEGSIDYDHSVEKLDSVYGHADEQNVPSRNKSNCLTVFGEDNSRTKNAADNTHSSNSVDVHINTSSSNLDLKNNLGICKSEYAIETYQIAKLDDLQRKGSYNCHENSIENHCEQTKEIVSYQNDTVADNLEQYVSLKKILNSVPLTSSKSTADDIEGNVKTDSGVSRRNESDVIDCKEGLLDGGLDNDSVPTSDPIPEVQVSGILKEVIAVHAKSDTCRYSPSETNDTCKTCKISVLPTDKSKVMTISPSLYFATLVQKHIEACILDQPKDKSHLNLATEKEKNKMNFVRMVKTSPDLQHTSSGKVHNIVNTHGSQTLHLQTIKKKEPPTVSGSSNVAKMLHLPTTKKKETPTVFETSDVAKVLNIPTTKKKETPTVSGTSNVAKMLHLPTTKKKETPTVFETSDVAKVLNIPTTKKKETPTVSGTSNVAKQLHKPKTKTKKIKTADFEKLPTNCDRCNIEFSSVMCLFNHLVIYHLSLYIKEKTFYCPGCPSAIIPFNSYISNGKVNGRHSIALKVHLKAVHDIEDLKCMDCNLIFDNYLDYHKHVHGCCTGSKQNRFSTDGTGEGKLKHLHCPLCKSMHIIIHKSSLRHFWNVKDNLLDELDTAVLRRKVTRLEDNAIRILEMPRFCCKVCGMHLHGFTCFLNHIFQNHKNDLISDIPKVDEKDCHMKDEKRKVCGKKHSLPTAFVEHVRNILQNNGLLPVLNRKKQSIEDSEYSDSDLEDKEHLKTKGSNDKVKVSQPSAKLVSEVLVHPESRSKCKTNPSQKEEFQNSVLTKETEVAEKFVKTDLADTVINECKTTDPHIAETKTKEATIDFQHAESLVGRHKDSVLLNDVKRYLLVDKSFTTLQNYCLRFNLIKAKTKEEIGDHMIERINATVEGFECGICFQQFKEYSCCKNHVLTDHYAFYWYKKGSEVFTCPMCSVSLNVLSSFQEHLEFHGIFNFKCDQCNVKFNRQKEFEKHKKHRPPSSLFQPDPRFSCKHCSCMHNCIEMPGEANRCREKGTGTLATNSIASRKRNINTISVNTSILDKSQKTDLVFSKVSFDGDKYVCTECMDSFDFLDCCTTHILFDHKKSVGKYCSICKNDEKYDNIMIHLRQCHNTMPFYCKKCNKGFSNSIELKLHFSNCSELLSSEEMRNPYICQKCFQLHVPYRSGKIDTQSCKECQQGFQSISCARNHYFVEHIHEDIAVTSKLNTFHCPCGKGFVCRSELYQHMKNKHEKVKECEKTVENSPHTLQMDESVSCELNDEMDIDSTVEGTGLDKNSMVQSPDMCGEFKVKDAGNKYDERLQTRSICHEAETDIFKPTKHGQFDNWMESDKAWRKCDTCSHLHIVTSETVKTVNKKTRATCGICKQKFKDQKCALHHELMAHPNNNHLYQCVGCNLYFVSSSTLRTHQGRSLADKECTVSLTDGNKLKDSVASKSKISTLTGTGDIQSFSCKVEKCKKCAEIHLSQFDMKEIETRANLKMEHDSRQSTVMLTCQVKYCNFTTNSLIAFKKHKQEEHSKGHVSKTDICPVCNAKFSSTKETLAHVVEDHGKVKIVKGELIKDINKSYGCNYCSKKYQFAMDCQMHLRIDHFEKPLIIVCHTIKDEQRMKCPVPLCPICFKVNLAYYSEKKTHSTKIHLRQHFFIGRHAKAVVHVCAKCGREGNSTCLSCKREKAREKKFKCNICGKAYSGPIALRTHRDSHSEKRLHRCNVCGKEFKYITNLKTHELTHLEKTLACLICGMKFRLPHHVRAHAKRAHQVDTD